MLSIQGLFSFPSNLPSIFPDSTCFGYSGIVHSRAMQTSTFGAWVFVRVAKLSWWFWHTPRLGPVSEWHSKIWRPWTPVKKLQAWVWTDSHSRPPGTAAPWAEECSPSSSSLEPTVPCWTSLHCESWDPCVGSQSTSSAHLVWTTQSCSGPELANSWLELGSHALFSWSPQLDKMAVAFYQAKCHRAWPSITPGRPKQEDLTSLLLWDFCKQTSALKIRDHGQRWYFYI